MPWRSSLASISFGLLTIATVHAGRAAPAAAPSACSAWAPAIDGMVGGRWLCRGFPCSGIGAALSCRACFFLSGLTCRATPSQSARSSSLRMRLRRVGADSIRQVASCFIGRRGRREMTQRPRSGSIAGRASGNGTCGQSPQPAAKPCATVDVGLQRSPDPLPSPWPVSSAETALRSSPTAADPAAASCGRAPPDRGSSAPA